MLLPGFLPAPERLPTWVFIVLAVIELDFVTINQVYA